MAAAELDSGEVAHPVRDILRHIPNADFCCTRVERIDTKRRLVFTAAKEFPYDYLVLSPGSVDNYFDVPGAQDTSFGIKTMGQSLALRNRVLSQFELAARNDDAAERRLLTSFAIVGGGPTGVEFAGALIDLIRHSLAGDFKHLDVTEARVTLVDGVDHLLGPFAPSLRRAALKRLGDWGVTVRLGSSVAAVTDSGLELADGTRVEAATVIWAAGVRASPLGASIGVDLQRSERVSVSPTLQLVDHPEVFVIGDLAHVESGQGDGPLPMLAPVAIQEGRHAAQSIVALVRGETPKPFAYQDKGMMAAIGRNNAIAQVGPLRLTGFPGWLVWAVVHIVYIISHRSKVVVVINWTTAYLFHNRPLRLITGPLQPPGPAQQGDRDHD